MRLQLFLMVLGLISVCFYLPTSGEPSFSSNMLLGDFTKGWEKEWETKLLFRRGNRFRVVEEDSNKVLSVHSAASASGIFRKVKLKPIVPGTISWLWKIKSSLETNMKERSKDGDDYAARVFLLYEPSFFRWRIPTVCYVWAGNQNVGSIFKSPYTNTVCMIVLQSGNQRSGEWIREERDYIEDYKKCFDRTPKELSAVAIMVDTDDTGAQTTTWFDEVILKTKN